MMKAKVYALRLIKSLLFVIIIFGGLIVSDYFYTCEWLTDKSAICILIITFILSFIVDAVIFNFKKRRKDEGNHRPLPPQKRECITPKSNNPIKTFRRFCIVSAAPILIAVCIITGYTVYKSQLDVPVPYEISEFGEKYPEANEYVKNYPKYYNKSFKIDIREEMESQSIPLFIQWDKRWGYRHYGSSYIGISGCGPTCLSMVLCGLTDDETYTPLYISDYASHHGYYISGQGTSWSLFSDGAISFGLSVEHGTISESYIKNNLSSKTPMICSMKPGDFTYSGHFIVLTGIDSEGNVIVNDPNSPNNSIKHWKIETLVTQIKGIWTYSL